MYFKIGENGTVTDFAIGAVPINAETYEHSDDPALCTADFWMAPDGIPLKKWDGEKIIPRTPAEIAADRARLPPPPKTQEERLKALETLGENLNAGFKRLEKLFGGVRK